MTTQPSQAPSGIILMAKPDGVARFCTTDDVTKIHACWRDTLCWLRGTDPDDLEHDDVVRAVAQKAALRMPRYPEYDITTWMTEARALPDLSPAVEAPLPAPLIDVVTCILTGLGFTCTGEYNGWLNRITIELLYRQSNSFGANRELLIPALLKGPVAIRYLDGTQTELAHALKLTIRAAVAGTSSSFTNLIHMDLTTPRQRELITKSLGLHLTSAAYSWFPAFLLLLRSASSSYIVYTSGGYIEMCHNSSQYGRLAMSAKSKRTRPAKRNRPSNPPHPSTNEKKPVPAHQRLMEWLRSANKVVLGAIGAGIAGIITAAITAIPHQIAGALKNDTPPSSPLIITGGASPGVQNSNHVGTLNSAPSGSPNPCDLAGEYVIPGTVKVNGKVTTSDLARLINKAGDAKETDGSYTLQAGTGKSVLLTGIHTELLRRTPVSASTVIDVQPACVGAPPCYQEEEYDATINLDSANLTPKLSLLNVCSDKSTPVSVPASIITQGQPLTINFTANVAKYDVTWRLRFDCIVDGKAKSYTTPASSHAFQTDGTSGATTLTFFLNSDGKTWASSSSSLSPAGHSQLGRR